MANSMRGLTPEMTAEWVKRMQEAYEKKGAKSKAVRPAGMNPRSRALPSYVPLKQETPLPANANNSPDRFPFNPPPIPVQDLGYPPHASGALGSNQGQGLGYPPHASGALGQAPSYQDQFPVDGAVQGTNPNAAMMGGDETAGQPSMMDKIMGYKPDMGMQQLFEATGKAFGNPLIGVAPSAGGTSIGGEYSNLNPAYAEKKRTKLAADKLREQEESQENEKRQYIKMGLESGAITPKHAQRLMALKGVPKGIKDIIEAKTFGNVDNLGTYKGGRILKAPTSKNVGHYLDKETGNTLPFSQEDWINSSRKGQSKSASEANEDAFSEMGISSAENALAVIRKEKESPIWEKLIGPGTFSGRIADYLSADTPLGRIRQAMEPILATQSLDEMRRLREASPNGSTGLGQVTEFEHKIMQSKIAALNPETTDIKVLEKNVEEVLNYRRWLFNRKSRPDEGGLSYKEWLSKNKTDTKVKNLESELKRLKITPVGRVPQGG